MAGVGIRRLVENDLGPALVLVFLDVIELCSMIMVSGALIVESQALDLGVK